MFFSTLHYNLWTIPYSLIWAKLSVVNCPGAKNGVIKNFCCTKKWPRRGQKIKKKIRKNIRKMVKKILGPLGPFLAKIDFGGQRGGSVPRLLPLPGWPSHGYVPMLPVLLFRIKNYVISSFKRRIEVPHTMIGKIHHFESKTLQKSYSRILCMILEEKTSWKWKTRFTIIFTRFDTSLY